MNMKNGILLGFGLLLLLSFFTFLGCIEKVENYELGYTFDLRTGKIEELPRQGYFITPPFVVKLHTIDLRPTQVCINATSRVLNCKLVKFNSKGLQEFVAWHGRGDYKVDQNATITTSFENILMSYAYDESGETYPFIETVKEFGAKNEKEFDEIKVSVTDTTINNINNGI